MKDELDRNAYPPLPTPLTEAGDRRLVGVELEFAGLAEDAAARILADEAGGRARQEDGNAWSCETDRFGTCEIYLDSRFAGRIADIAGEAALDAARHVVPVEIVTEPFDPADLPRLDRVIEALRRRGATGSRAGLFLGFGTHLNIAIASDREDRLHRVVTAFALLEASLRRTAHIDISRRLLPFVDPYPDELVTSLADAQLDDARGLIGRYLAHTTSRNHGLDMLPIFAWLDEGRVMEAVGHDPAVSARPAYHFRLPDCRIDEAGWTPSADWRRWVFVEEVAEQSDLLGRLCEARRAWAKTGALSRPDWADRADAILDEHEKTVPQ